MGGKLEGALENNMKIVEREIIALQRKKRRRYF